MGFEANRQQVFSKRIVDLPDQPDMSARDLKAYFDSSAKELRQSFNGLCDALSDFCGGQDGLPRKRRRAGADRSGRD